MTDIKLSRIVNKHAINTQHTNRKTRRHDMAAFRVARRAAKSASALSDIPLFKQQLMKLRSLV